MNRAKYPRRLAETSQHGWLCSPLMSTATPIDKVRISSHITVGAPLPRAGARWSASSNAGCDRRSAASCPDCSCRSVRSMSRVRVFPYKIFIPSIWTARRCAWCLPGPDFDVYASSTGCWCRIHWAAEQRALPQKSDREARPDKVDGRVFRQGWLAFRPQVHASSYRPTSANCRQVAQAAQCCWRPALSVRSSAGR